MGVNGAPTATRKVHVVNRRYAAPKSPEIEQFARHAYWMICGCDFLALPWD